MKLQPLPTAEYVKSLISYNPETGEFHRACDRKRWKKGEKVGGIKKNGYVYVGIDQGRYVAHRLAWLVMTGNEPSSEVDHINGIKSDNRWSNLRLASHSQNGMNKSVQSKSQTGVKGVYPYKGKFRAKVSVDGKTVEVGVFDTIEEAKAAHIKLAQALHGDFFCP